VSNLIRRAGNSVLFFRALTVAWLCLFPLLFASADGNTRKTDTSSHVLVSDSAAVHRLAPVVVFGFVGGNVHHDDSVHSTVKVAQRLRKDSPRNVHVETFENNHMADAHGLLLYLLGAGRTGTLTDEQKQAARIILYGHGSGARTVVALAEKLNSEGIPVLLTIQVDSAAKRGQNDAVIPENVRYAANFYQEKGLIHGQKPITAADASRTQILGNFRMDYSDHPVSCEKSPWYTRVVPRSHNEIECDPHVWQKVEDLIREQLPASVASMAN
jgi:hypothetical protein